MDHKDAKPDTAADPPAFARAIRIAIVDDELEMADALSQLFSLWGHDVIVATDAASALERLPEFRPHLVLMDMGLPVNGAALATELRRRVGFERVCIAALTGSSDDESRKKAVASRMDMYLVKPVQPEALRALVAAVAVATHIQAGS